MCKKILRSFLVSFAIITSIVGILIVSIKQSAFSADTYTKALDNSGIYKILTEQMTSQTFGEGTQIYTDFIFENLDIEEIFQKTANTNLERAFEWLNYNSDQLHIFVPVNEIKENISNDDLIALNVDSFDEHYKTLPECTPKQIQKLLVLDFDNLSEESDAELCYSEEFESKLPEFKEAFSTLIQDETADKDLVEEMLKSFGLENVEENISVTELLQGETNEETANNVNNFEMIRFFFRVYGIIGWVLIVISLIAALLFVLTGRKRINRIIANFANIFIITAVVVTILSFLLPSVTKRIINSIPEEPTEFISSVIDTSKLSKSETGEIEITGALENFDLKTLVQTIKTLGNQILDTIWHNTQIVGVVLLFGTIILRLGAIILYFLREDKQKIVIKETVIPKTPSAKPLQISPEPTSKQRLQQP